MATRTFAEGRAQLFLGVMVGALALAGACNGTRQVPSRDGGPGSSDGSMHGGDGTVTLHDVGPCLSTDSDGNGISDNLEDPHNADDDGDTIDDRTENTAGMGGPGTSNPPICAPTDCDSDGVANFKDLDSDNDGLSDAQEAVNHTNECNPDSDGDGISDLIEVAAGTNPLDMHSMPPATSLYVTLPYYDPAGAPGPHATRMFDFHTNIQQADVYIIVDNSASMAPIIDALRTTFTSTIVPGIHAAIPDARIGVGSFDSLPDGIDGDPGDYTFWARQRVDADPTLSQNALNNMHTIDTDRGTPNNCPVCGGDLPEDQVEAIFEAVAGDGMTGHEGDAPSNVTDALNGNGYVPRMDPVRDCGAAPDGAAPFGWACFESGRVPIIVLASDAGWYNSGHSFQALTAFGSTVTVPPVNDAHMHTLAEAQSALMAHGAYFIGVDVGDFMNTMDVSLGIATATGTVDQAGAAIVFDPGTGGISGAGNDIVNAITTIAGHTPQDITTRTDPDPNEHRLTAPHTTADFVKMVTPDHGTPDMPTGYVSKDATTFYGVNPSTIVWFNVDFYNDFQPSTDTAQLFRATIQVLGRARSIVDHRDVYIVVPPTGGQAPPS
jgi:hypothetical protein